MRRLSGDDRTGDSENVLKGLGFFQKGGNRIREEANHKQVADVAAINPACHRRILFHRRGGGRQEGNLLLIKGTRITGEIPDRGTK